MMDNKRLIIAMVLGLAVIVLYNQVLLPWLDKRIPGWDLQTSATTQPETQPSAAQPATSEPSSRPAVAEVTAGPSTSPATRSSADAGATIVPTTQPVASGSGAISIGRADWQDSQYALQLNLDPRGAGLDSVVLNSFRRTTRGTEPYTFETPPVSDTSIVPFASRSVTVDGRTYDLATVQWAVVSKTPERVVYGADLVRSGLALLEIRKTFTISQRSADNKGYEIGLEYEFRNPTDQPRTIQTSFNGPVFPPAETFRQPDRQVVGGYRDGDSIDVQFHPVEEFNAEKNRIDIDLLKYKAETARWSGAASNYFAAVILPETMTVNGAPTNADDFTAISAHGLNLTAESTDDHDGYTTYQTGDIRIEPHKSAVMPLSVFLGPKWRDVLDDGGTPHPHYAILPRLYNLLLIIRGGMCGFCTFAWLVNGIVYLLQAMHWVLRDWGLAIIGLVAIVRVILHPITRRSQISMSRMSKMAPEMKRLQEKYKDDKDALNKAMVEFHKEQGIGPYLGCLPMFLQTPIWIALYGVLETTFELRQAPFLWNFTWIHDLSQPDYLIRFAHPISVWFFELRGLNLVPVLMAGAMALQTQFMPQPVAATPEQMKQQQMMKWLQPIMFLVFFYSLPSGLNLYIFTSTVVGVIESKLVRDHIRAREETEKAGKVFVETKATRASRQVQGRSAPEKPANGIVGRLSSLWGRLLEQAEQARQDRDRRK